MHGICKVTAKATTTATFDPQRNETEWNGQRTTDNGQRTSRRRLLGQTNYALQRHENLLHMKTVVKLARHTPQHSPAPSLQPQPSPRCDSIAPVASPPRAFHFSALIKSSSKSIGQSSRRSRSSTLPLLLLLHPYVLCKETVSERPTGPGRSGQHRQEVGRSS